MLVCARCFSLHCCCHSKVSLCLKTETKLHPVYWKKMYVVPLRQVLFYYLILLNFGLFYFVLFKLITPYKIQHKFYLNYCIFFYYFLLLFFYFGFGFILYLFLCKLLFFLFNSFIFILFYSSLFYSFYFISIFLFSVVFYLYMCVYLYIKYIF